MKHNQNPFISSPPEVLKLVDSFNNQLFSVKNCGLTYRALNHYQSNGVIDNIKNNEKSWRKFSAIELVWIKVIKELRKLGISLEKIRIIKDQIFDEGQFGTIDKAQFINNSFEVEIALSIHNKYDLYLIIFSDFTCSFHDSQSTKHWVLKLYKEEANINIPLKTIIKEVLLLVDRN
jgi:DNA-binding transcriptional MerR regulator